MTLSNVYLNLECINSNSSRLAKEKMIQKFCKDPLFVKVAYLALNPYIKFNTTQVNFNNLPAKNGYERNLDNLFKMLNYLSQKRGATNEDIYWLTYFASIDKQTADVVKRIVNKDLRCGASIKTFRKFIPTIPDFGCMLCEKDFEKFLKLVKHDMTKIVWSLKLDGVRCISDTKMFRYYSRNGKEFPNFNVFNESIDRLVKRTNKFYPEIKEIFFDGEVTAKTDQAKDFQKLMTQVQRLSQVDPSIFEYTIFDMMLDPKYTFGQRYNILRSVFYEFESENVKFLPHHMYPPDTKESDILKHAEELCKQGHEGIVLKNIDSSYLRKRSREWCKIKMVHTTDVHVIGFEMGNGKYSNVLGKMLCLSENGVEFGVGSGFTDQEREYYMSNLPDVIEVKYQELTKDGAPRFPIFVRVREDK